METPAKKVFLISSTEHSKVGGLSYTVLNPQNLKCAFSPWANFPWKQIFILLSKSLESAGLLQPRDPRGWRL